MSETRTDSKQPRINAFKWLWLLLAFILVAMLGSYALQKLVIMPSFITLEHDEAGKNLARCLEAITNEVQHLDRFCADGVIWQRNFSSDRASRL